MQGKQESKLKKNLCLLVDIYEDVKQNEIIKKVKSNVLKMLTEFSRNKFQNNSNSFVKEVYNILSTENKDLVKNNNKK